MKLKEINKEWFDGLYSLENIIDALIEQIQEKEGGEWESVVNGACASSAFLSICKEIALLKDQMIDLGDELKRIDNEIREYDP